MGQSQSQIEKNKQRPINPQKIFGLILFQRSYDEVVQNKKELIEMKYAEEKAKQPNQDAFDEHWSKIFSQYDEETKK